MTTLVVRRLLIDLHAPFSRHWCDGDPFRSALFGALSMSFPSGEQFFIDSVRAAFAALPPAQQDARRTEVQGFTGQEATHRRLHALFNEQLERQGWRNRWGPRIVARTERLKKRFKNRAEDPRHALAATAASEHLTAILAEWLLGHPSVLADSPAHLRALWEWHASEEAEHKSVAFDLYQALAGDHRWRIFWFRFSSLVFLIDLLRQTAANLHADGTLWRPRTWRSAAHWLFGRAGMVRCTWRPWREYLRHDFHPHQLDSALAQRWLAQHRDAYAVVGASD